MAKWSWPTTASAERKRQAQVKRDRIASVTTSHSGSFAFPTRAGVAKESFRSRFAGKEGQFAAQIRDWSDSAIKRSDAVIKKTIFDIFARIVMRTPVLTGHLRANWQVGINNCPTTEYDYVDPEGTTTLQIGSQMVEAAKGFGDTFYITNNLPYAIPIEYGWSHEKAPEGMVRVTMVEFQDVFYSAARSA